MDVPISDRHPALMVLNACPFECLPEQRSDEGSLLCCTYESVTAFSRKLKTKNSILAFRRSLSLF